MKTTIYAILISVILTGCQFSKSVKKDLLSGITSIGNNLSCDDVYITVNKEKSIRSTFVYGEIFYLNYNDIKGFTRVNGNAYPGLEIFIVSQAGDTVLRSDDLYSKYQDGMNYTPLLLSTDITIASPISSNSGYTMHVKIWDKKGNGTFTSKFDFNVIENEKIAIEPTGVSYNEVYLFSEGDNKVITDSKGKFNDNIHLIIEGLTGFREENNLLFPGLSLKVTDSEKKSVLDYQDLFLDYSTKGVAVSDFITRVSSHFKVSGTKVNNPLSCEMIIWDKKSDSRIKINTKINLE
jgi:hypothetical protein